MRWRGCGRTGSDRAEAKRVYVANLRYAAERLAAEGITAIIEPINNRDIPGYFLNYARPRRWRSSTRSGTPICKLQLDLYHVQIMEGDLAHHIRALAGHYPHIQIAGNPGRHEPDVGEINYPFLFDLFDEIGYAGWIGCEYRPQGRDESPGSAGPGATASEADRGDAPMRIVITGRLAARF